MKIRTALGLEYEHRWYHNLINTLPIKCNVCGFRFYWYAFLRHKLSSIRNGVIKMVKIRKITWQMFGWVLSPLGYGAETNEDESVFYIMKVHK